MIRLLYWIIALLLGGYGYLCIRSPEDAIYLVNFWRFREYEPSDRFIWWTRVGGVFYIILAIVLVVLSFKIEFNL